MALVPRRVDMENRVLPEPQRDTVLQSAVELPERSPLKSLLSKPAMQKRLLLTTQKRKPLLRSKCAFCRPDADGNERSASEIGARGLSFCKDQCLWRLAANMGHHAMFVFNTMFVFKRSVSQTAIGTHRLKPGLRSGPALHW